MVPPVPPPGNAGVPNGRDWLSLPPVLSQRLAIRREAVWMQIGSLRGAMLDREGALQAFEKVLTYNPRNVQAMTQAGAALAKKEAYPQAVSYLRRAINADQNCGEAWAVLAHCYVMTDELHQAYQAYQSALSHLPNPKDPNLWYGIGLLYDRYGSLENALEAFLAVLQISPHFERAEEVCFCIGIIYKEQSKFDQSLEYFNKAVSASTPPPPLTRADTWYQIGHVHELKKDIVSAMDTYYRALSENPAHSKSLQQLAWLRHQAGHSDDAVALLQRSTRADGTDGQSWYLLGRVYMSKKDFRLAYEAYQQAVYREHGNPTFWCSIGVLYYQMQQYRDAMDAYSRAIRINPEVSEVWYDLGTLYESCSQISDAVDAYRRAAELAPSNTQITQRLQLLEQSLASGVPPPAANPNPPQQPEQFQSSNHHHNPHHPPADPQGQQHEGHMQHQQHHQPVKLQQPPQPNQPSHSMAQSPRQGGSIGSAMQHPSSGPNQGGLKSQPSLGQHGGGGQHPSHVSGPPSGHGHPGQQQQSGSVVHGHHVQQQHVPPPMQSGGHMSHQPHQQPPHSQQPQHHQMQQGGHHQQQPHHQQQQHGGSTPRGLSLPQSSPLPSNNMGHHQPQHHSGANQQQSQMQSEAYSQAQSQPPQMQPSQQQSHSQMHPLRMMQSGVQQPQQLLGGRSHYGSQLPLPLPRPQQQSLSSPAMRGAQNSMQPQQPYRSLPQPSQFPHSSQQHHGHVQSPSMGAPSAPKQLSQGGGGHASQHPHPIPALGPVKPPTDEPSGIMGQIPRSQPVPSNPRSPLSHTGGQQPSPSQHQPMRLGWPAENDRHSQGSRDRGHKHNSYASDEQRGQQGPLQRRSSDDRQGYIQSKSPQLQAQIVPPNDSPSPRISLAPKEKPVIPDRRMDRLSGPPLSQLPGADRPSGVGNRSGSGASSPDQDGGSTPHRSGSAKDNGARDGQQHLRDGQAMPVLPPLSQPIRMHGEGKGRDGGGNGSIDPVDNARLPALPPLAQSGPGSKTGKPAFTSPRRDGAGSNGGVQALKSPLRNSTFTTRSVESGEGSHGGSSPHRPAALDSPQKEGKESIANMEDDGDASSPTARKKLSDESDDGAKLDDRRKLEDTEDEDDDEEEEDAGSASDGNEKEGGLARQNLSGKEVGQGELNTGNDPSPQRDNSSRTPLKSPRSPTKSVASPPSGGDATKDHSLKDKGMGGKGCSSSSEKSAEKLASSSDAPRKDDDKNVGGGFDKGLTKSAKSSLPKGDLERDIVKENDGTSRTGGRAANPSDSEPTETLSRGDENGKRKSDEGKSPTLDGKESTRGSNTTTPAFGSSAQAVFSKPSAATSLTGADSTVLKRPFSPGADRKAGGVGQASDDGESSRGQKRPRTDEGGSAHGADVSVVKKPMKTKLPLPPLSGPTGLSGLSGLPALRSAPAPQPSTPSTSLKPMKLKDGIGHSPTVPRTLDQSQERDSGRKGDGAAAGAGGEDGSRSAQGAEAPREPSDDDRNNSNSSRRVSGIVRNRDERERDRERDRDRDRESHRDRDRDRVDRDRDRDARETDRDHRDHRDRDRNRDERGGRERGSDSRDRDRLDRTPSGRRDWDRRDRDRRSDPRMRGDRRDRR